MDTNLNSNPKLFTVCGSPARIFLDGLNYLDILSNARLVIMYGGIVVSQPDDDTIVLAPSTSSSSAKCTRFNINWLHGCISANEFLDIAKYILPSRSDDNVKSTKQPTVGYCAKSSENVEIVKIEKQKYSEIDDSSTGSSSSLPENLKTQGTKRSLSSSLNTLRKKEDSATRDSVKSTVEKPTVVPPKSSDVVSDSKDSDSGEMTDTTNDNYTKRPSDGSEGARTSSSRESCFSEFNSDSEVQSKWKQPRVLARSTGLKKKQYRVYSEKENQSMINYLIKNNAIAKARGPAVWKKAKTEGMFVNPCRSATSLTAHFLSCLRYDVTKYTDDPVALREFEKLKQPTRGKYTEDEKKRIVQYLIEKRAICKAHQRGIWKKMEADKIFQSPHRSAKNLRQFFLTQMRRNFKLYTDDAQALKQFRILFDIYDRNLRTNYSKKEDQTIIRYLIERNGVSTSSISTWKQMVARKIFVRPFRSANSLYSRFHNYLQYHIAAYTDDPQVLIKLKPLLKRST